MNAMRVAGGLALVVATLLSTETQAQHIDSIVKIGVLTDMSSVYSDIGGPGSVAAARLAVEDFNPAAHAMKVEIVSADHQNKPDIGANIARKWFDIDGVDMITDVLIRGWR
jgi:branched-chain amino acid transport system substrate-binding protein